MDYRPRSPRCELARCPPELLPDDPGRYRWPAVGSARCCYPLVRMSALSERTVARLRRGTEAALRLDSPSALTKTIWQRAVRSQKRRCYAMELAGLEPATSWVRSRRSPN